MKKMANRYSPLLSLLATTTVLLSLFFLRCSGQESEFKPISTPNDDPVKGMFLLEKPRSGNIDCWENDIDTQHGLPVNTCKRLALTYPESVGFVYDPNNCFIKRVCNVHGTDDGRTVYLKRAPVTAKDCKKVLFERTDWWDFSRLLAPDVSSVTSSGYWNNLCLIEKSSGSTSPPSCFYSCPNWKYCHKETARCQKCDRGRYATKYLGFSGNENLPYGKGCDQTIAAGNYFITLRFNFFF